MCKEWGMEPSSAGKITTEAKFLICHSIKTFGEALPRLKLEVSLRI
jgi:hypothetical protein